MNNTTKLMLRFFQKLTAVDTTEYFSRQMTCQKIPRADAVNKKLEEECIDPLAGSVWFAE